MEQKEYKQIIEDWKLEHKEEIESDKCKKIFLDILIKCGKNISWKNNINHKIYFICKNIEGWIEIISYNKYKTNLTVKYNNNIFYINTGNFTKCNLDTIVKTRTSDFKVEIGSSFKDDKRDIIIIDREIRINKKGFNRKWYKYHCNICNWDEGWMPENSLIKQKIGCSCCCGRTTVKGINDIATTHPDLVKYFVNIEDSYKNTYGSDNKVYFKCLNCGFEKEMKISRLNKEKFSCSRCGDNIPYGEKIMFNILEQLNIEFQTQLSKTTYKWCKDYRYDFYFELNSEGYVIEINGIQHYEENTNFKMTLEEVKLNDKLKKELALDNGIKEENYIIIDCRKSELDWIKQNISDSNLAKIFDVSEINWLKAEEYTLSTRIKEACEIKRNNLELTCNDIGRLMKITKETVCVYLKKGSKIWDWINYDAKKEKFKASSKNGKSKAKPIIVFKNDKYLKIFNSGIEIERKSEELFKTKLSHKGISEVCTGRIKSHKGYQFKYIEDLTQEEYIKYDIENKLKELYELN